MDVAAAVLAPLTENCGAGTSAMASLNVTASVNAVPCLTIPVGASVMVAVGGVVSPSTALVSGGVTASGALLPAASLIVPPFNPIGEIAAMPCVSFSPDWTTYRNTSALVPVPDR